MEEKKLNEQESLALIAEMIQSTKNYLNNDRGRWNLFLFYGLYTAVLGSLICLVILLTRNGMFCWLWVLMFVPSLVSKLKGRKRESAVTYTGAAISSFWKVLDWMCVLSFLALTAMTFIFHDCRFMIILMPLSLIFVCIGVSATGVLLGDKLVTYIPLAGLPTAFYIILIMVQSQQFPLWGMLAFSLTFLVVAFLPGWLLKFKSGTK